MAKTRKNQVNKVIKKTIKNGDIGTKIFKRTNDLNALKLATSSYDTAIKAMVLEIKLKK